MPKKKAPARSPGKSAGKRAKKPREPLPEPDISDDDSDDFCMIVESPVVAPPPRQRPHATAGSGGGGGGGGGGAGAGSGSGSSGSSGGGGSNSGGGGGGGSSGVGGGGGWAGAVIPNGDQFQQPMLDYQQQVAQLLSASFMGGHPNAAAAALHQVPYDYGGYYGFPQPPPPLPPPAPRGGTVAMSPAAAAAAAAAAARRAAAAAAIDRAAAAFLAPAVAGRGAAAAGGAAAAPAAAAAAAGTPRSRRRREPNPGEVKEEPVADDISPQTPAEVQALAILRQSGFGQEESLLGLRACGGQLHVAYSWILQQRALAEDSRNEDQARLRSELDKEDIKRRQREEESELTVHGDIAGSRYFTNSVLLGAETGCLEFRQHVTRISSGDYAPSQELCAFREAAVKLLLMERDAFKWYEQLGPAVTAYFCAVAKRLRNAAGDGGDDSGGSDDGRGSDGGGGSANGGGGGSSTANGGSGSAGIGSSGAGGGSSSANDGSGAGGGGSSANGGSGAGNGGSSNVGGGSASGAEGGANCDASANDGENGEADVALCGLPMLTRGLQREVKRLQNVLYMRVDGKPPREFHNGVDNGCRRASLDHDGLEEVATGTAARPAEVVDLGD